MNYASCSCIIVMFISVWLFFYARNLMYISLTLPEYCSHTMHKTLFVLAFDQMAHVTFCCIIPKSVLGNNFVVSKKKRVLAVNLDIVWSLHPYIGIVCPQVILTFMLMTLTSLSPSWLAETAPLVVAYAVMMQWCSGPEKWLVKNLHRNWDWFVWCFVEVINKAITGRGVT